MADEQARPTEDDEEILDALGDLLAADHLLDTIVAARRDEEGLEKLGELPAADHLLDAVEMDTMTQTMQPRAADPLEAPTIVEKPWGREIWYAAHDKYAGKVLEVSAGKRLSLQKHAIKEETLYLLSGHVRLTYGGEQFDWLPGTLVHIPTGTVHRFEAINDSVLLEVSTPHLDDVIRLSDDYGRTS